MGVTVVSILAMYLRFSLDEIGLLRCTFHYLVLLQQSRLRHDSGILLMDPFLYAIRTHLLIFINEVQTVLVQQEFHSSFAKVFFFPPYTLSLRRQGSRKLVD